MFLYGTRIFQRWSFAVTAEVTGLVLVQERVGGRHIGASHNAPCLLLLSS